MFIFKRIFLALQKRREPTVTQMTEVILTSLPAFEHNLPEQFDLLPREVKDLLAIVRQNDPASAAALLQQNHLVQQATEYWHYASIAANKIAEMCQEQDLDPATGYIAGLLHNSGLLLFSHLFPPEYRLLQKWLRINPRTSIVELEQRILGMGQAFYMLRFGHAEIGARLLAHFGIGEPFCTIAREHHTQNYAGEFSPYIKIIQLTNQVLRRQGLGDGDLDLTFAQLDSNIQASF